MIKNERADATNIGSVNPFDYFDDAQTAFGSDYAEKTGDLQSDLTAHITRHKKVIRLFRCFACERNFTARKMSNCLAICRECYGAAQGKGKVARQNFVERTLNNFHKFLRRRV